ncbi:hypothetical protein V6N13_045313 [Hibiscus sabdariffa]
MVAVFSLEVWTAFDATSDIDAYENAIAFDSGKHPTQRIPLNQVGFYHSETIMGVSGKEIYDTKGAAMEK